MNLLRTIAAPTIGKFCSASSATVIKVSSEVVSKFPMTLIDGYAGKICVDINYKTFEGRLKLMELIKDSVLGLCAKHDRGIIYVQQTCYGWKGNHYAFCTVKCLTMNYRKLLELGVTK